MPKLTSAIPVLTALDVAAAVQFWTRQLGFSELFNSAGEFAGVGRDSVTLYISYAEDQSIPDNTQAWIRVADLDALHAEWQEVLGADAAGSSDAILTDIGEMPWGNEFVVIDPAGNCVHFAAES